MKTLSNNDIMAYLDGALDARRRGEVEAHLRENAEDAELVNTMKLALGALKSWNEDEPVRVSENFWPSLRDRLGPAPRRSLWHRWSAQLGSLLAPARSPWGLSAGIAAAVAVVFMAASLLGPRAAMDSAAANQLSPDDMTFITQSLQRHQAYAASPPINTALKLPAGDSRNVDFGDSDDDSDDHTR